MTFHPASPLLLERRRRPGRGGRAGLTIIEVAVSLGVLSILLLGLIASMRTGMSHGLATREHQAASEAAQTELDLAMAQPYESLVNIERPFHVEYFTGALDAGGLPRRARLRPASAAFFPLATADPTAPGRVRTFVNPDGNGSVDLVELRVTVAWRGADGRDQRVDFVSRRTRE